MPAFLLFTPYILWFFYFIYTVWRDVNQLRQNETNQQLSPNGAELMDTYAKYSAMQLPDVDSNRPTENDDESPDANDASAVTSSSSMLAAASMFYMF